MRACTTTPSTGRVCQAQRCSPTCRPASSSSSSSSAPASAPRQPSSHSRAPTRRGSPLACSYAEAYKQIRENRAAKAAQKKARQEAELRQEAGEPEGEGEPSTSADLVSQKGDVVTLRWSATLAATGEAVDSRKTHFSLLTDAGERVLQLQLGNDVGFEPKRGLKLAFSEACFGLRVGESTTVVSRPSGSGWFRAFEVWGEGRLLSQLTQDERASSWAEEETAFTVEVLKITPARGREDGRSRRRV